MIEWSTIRSLPAAARIVMLGGLSAALAWTAVDSLDWSYRHDFPLLHYAAWLFDVRGAVPYRDLFEFNMPGTYLLHRVMGLTAGWDPDGIRWFDLVWLGVTLAAIALALRRFGPHAMWGGAVSVGLLYLGLGPYFTLQREWVLLLPILGAVALAMGRGPARNRRAAAMGALVGVAAMVKPHAALALPVLVIHEALRRDSLARPARRRLLASSMAAGLGFLVPVAGALIWVAAIGGLGDFWEILTRYTPLYSDLTGHHRAVADGDRWRWVLKDFALRGRTWLAVGVTIPGLLAALGGERRPHVRRAAWLLAALTGAFTFYPLIAGKLWPYHFLPQEVFAAMTAALLLTSRPGGSRRRAIATTLVVAGAIAVAVVTGGLPAKRPPPPERAEEIGAYLAENLRDGETVQPLDWTAGAVHGMLLARAPIATRFLYDFHFYHHVSDPYIVALRADFMSDLRAARPAFVLRMTKRPWPRGEDTAAVFPELEEFLGTHYDQAKAGDGYVILVRRDR